MSTQSHYEINVSERYVRGTMREGQEYAYRHLFATASRSCVTREEFERVHRAIATRFPRPEFKVDATYYECIGHGVPTPIVGDAKGKWAYTLTVRWPNGAVEEVDVQATSETHARNLAVEYEPGWEIIGAVQHPAGYLY